MATSIFDLARQFGGVVENTKPQPEEDSLLSLARQFGGEVVETAPSGVEVEEPVNPEEQRRLGPAGPVGFGVLDLLVAPFAREKDPRLTGVARGAELLGSGLEATARVSDILPEAAPPTTPVISTIKSAAPQLQEWANNLSNWGKQFDSEYATDLGSLTENPANAVPFIIERFIGSLPDMAAATYALPAYIPALANDILNQRLENDGKTIEQATIGDVAAATAAAAIQGPLERFATRRLGEPGGVLGQTAFQAGTEAAQEVTQYAAETAGTQVGFDPEQAGLIGLEAGIVGGGIGAAAGATNTVEQNAIRRNIEERFRRGEDVRSEEEMIELDRLREKAFEDAKGIVAPELPVDAEPLQFGTAYSERIYDSIGQYIPANEEFKVEEKVVDGIARFVVTDRNGTQYGQALGNKSQADALSNSLNNTTQERAKVLEQLYPLQRSLSEVMKGYGLNDVALSIDKRIFTRRGKALTSEGLFDPVVRQVFLAVDAVDPDGTLDPSQRREALRGVLRHEVVHALRYLDLWKKSEWKNLEKTVSTLKKPGTEETYLQIASKNYGDQSKVIQVEEAVAELIRDVAGNLSKVAGKPRSLSERAINFFDRAKNALTGSGFQTYEDIVRRVEEGIVGSRQRGRIRTLRATEEQMGYQGITPERIQPLFNNPEERNRFREETAQKMQAQVPAPSQPALNNLRLNAVRESRSTIDPVPPKIRVDEQEVPTRDSEGRLIYSGYEGPEVFGIQTRPTQEGLQNFWRWFGSSKVKDKQGRPQLFYHGTAADITEFRPKQAGSVFVTRSPQFAEEFSFYSDNYMVSNFPDFMSDQQVLDALDETLASPNAFAPKLYDEMYDARRQAALDVQNGKSIRPYALKKFKSIAAEGRSSRYLNAIQKRLPSSANLMPVYVKADKPWDYDSKNDVSSVVKRARDNGADITPSMIEEISQGNWQTIEGSEGNAPILDAIRELGYDSMYVEEQGEKNLAVFNPNQIKSAVGNTGDFSPLTPSIRESRVKTTEKFEPLSYAEDLALQALERSEKFGKRREKIQNNLEMLRLRLEVEGIKDPENISAAENLYFETVNNPPSNWDLRKPVYNIINSRTGEVVGQAKTIGGARRSVDRRDNQYGASVHTIQTVDPERDIAARNVARERLGLPPIERESRKPSQEIFYHGTRRGEIPVFDPTIGSTTGSWFTKNKAEAEKFGEAKGYTIDVKSPASMQDFAQARREVVQSGLDIMEDRQAFNRAVISNLEAKGFDGIRDKNFKGAGGVGEEVVAAFRPEQIKPVPSAREARRKEPVSPRIPPIERESRVRNPQLDTPEFQRFIKDSKVVDENGEPLVMYHGAKRDIEGGIFRIERGMLGAGVYFTRNPQEADFYTSNAAWRTEGNIVPAYISIKNPYITRDKFDKNLAFINRALHDGVILLDPNGQIEWAVPFSPNQIKSAVGNIGAFDITRPSIRESRVQTTKAPDWVSQKVWDLYEKARRADQESAGIVATEFPTRILRRNVTMSARRLMDGIGEYLGLPDRTTQEGSQQVIDFWNRLSEESYRRETGRDLNITRPSIRESRRSPNVVSLMSNEEQPPRKLRGKTQVAQYLQDRALEALGGRVRDLNIEADRDAIADDLVAEAIYEMEVQKNALEWYDSTIERTIEMMAIKHPEIKTDPNARTAFLVGLAITSQNLAVPDNLKYSEEVYNHFKKNGRFPEKGFGSKSPSIKRNFEKANMLIEELGSMEAFTDFLQTEFTVGQLNPILKGHLGKGAKVGGELVGAKVYGSSVFGPKIGNGFYTNLRGDFSPVTIDMWFMRTIGRLRGKVMEFDEKKFGKQLARLAKAEGMEGASTDDLVSRAQQLAKKHEKEFKQFRAEYDAGIRKKSESTNAAVTIVKSLKATRDAPGTGTEREQLRDIVNRAVNKMRDRTGQDISPAAFQALIWYPEQDLYKKLGVKLKHVRQDYANSTKQFLRREGIDERELKRAEDRVRSRRQRRAEPVRPGAVAPVEAAVTPAGERVSEPVQVAEAVVPRARESRVTGPASVTEPGPDTDIDTTGAAEALNEGQPVNSLGIPVGPLLTYTMPDGTVAPRARESRTGDPIRGAKIDPVMKRLIRSVEFFESAPDKLRGGVGLGDIASRIENYYDTWDARLGEVNNIIRNVTNSMSRSELRSAQDTFERYMTARENNRAQDAADIFRNATPNDRQLISAWESITNITGRVNRDVRGPDGEPIKVWDSKQEKWRPIGTIRDFFPRTLRREVMEVMMNPDLDPLLYDQLLDAVVTSGKAQTRDEAEDFLLRDYFSDEVKSDYFAGVEKARTEALPEIFYDYSWNAATRYLNKWARRTSQIEYFGQELGPFKKDWFDTNIPKIRNRETQDYLNQIKDRIYEVETFGFWNNAMKWGNQLATGLQLGNPASAFLNVVGGDVANIQMYGWREVAKAHASLLLDWRRVQEEGTKLGILNKDYLRITQDGIERDAGKYFATEDKVSVALSKFTDVILTFSGFNGAENIVRATAMLAARGFLDSSLRAINRNPNSNKSKKFIEYVNRENLDLDKLILENGAGPETDKFMRRGVNVPQGSYRIDMTPVFVDTNVGRFFFKYQKFGTQINRFFYRNFFKPWWDDKTDALKFLRLLAFLFPAIFGGEIINQFRRFLGYSGDYGPTYAQISKAFEKDETALGWGLIISRAMQNVTVAGSFGFFGNYYQFGKDVMDQQRVKNPMSPPALSSVDALIDLGYRIYDQGQLTARDFDEIAENTMSFYRANKRIALASMSELGSEAKEVKRFVAQRDIREIRRYGLRYAQDMEIEGKRQRTSSGPPVRTEMTPTNKAIVDALYQGDSATARTLIKQALKGKNFKEKQKTNQSIRASIRSRQPIQIGGSSPNNQERVAFLKWAKKNLSAEEYQKIVTMDRRYRRAAARVNMGFGDD